MEARVSEVIGRYQYFKKDIVGKGSSGKVYLGIDTINNQKVAIKIIDMSTIDNEVTRYLLQSEKSALIKIRNPYVLRVIEIIQEQKFCYLITEYCPGGTLKDRIQKRKRQNPNHYIYNEIQTLQIVQKLALGLQAISKEGFIHRDLKTANIMFRGDDPVIIDFGYCGNLRTKKPSMYYNVGSPSYMSPEAYQHCIYSEKSDIWALGVILFEMLVGVTIDYGMEIKQYFRQIKISGGVKLPNLVTNTCHMLLSFFFKINPDQRIGVNNLPNSIRATIKSTQTRLNLDRQPQSVSAPDKVFCGRNQVSRSFRGQGYRNQQKIDCPQQFSRHTTVNTGNSITFSLDQSRDSIRKLINHQIRDIQSQDNLNGIQDSHFKKRCQSNLTKPQPMAQEQYLKFSMKLCEGKVINQSLIPRKTPSCEVKQGNFQATRSFPTFHISQEPSKFPQNIMHSLYGSQFNPNHKRPRQMVEVQSVDSSGSHDDYTSEQMRPYIKGQLQQSKPQFTNSKQDKGPLFHSDILPTQPNLPSQIKRVQFKPWEFNQSTRNRTTTNLNDSTTFHFPDNGFTKQANKVTMVSLSKQPPSTICNPQLTMMQYIYPISNTNNHNFTTEHKIQPNAYGYVGTSSTFDKKIQEIKTCQNNAINYRNANIIAPGMGVNINIFDRVKAQRKTRGENISCRPGCQTIRI